MMMYFWEEATLKDIELNMLANDVIYHHLYYTEDEMVIFRPTNSHELASKDELLATMKVFDKDYTRHKK